jgi:hypothetical protein
MPSEEELMLAFKESGVEFVEQSAKAVGELGDKMESVNQAQAAAIEILKEEGTVVEDLKAKIAKLKKELEDLADAHKAGLITQDAYKEQSDKLVKVITENETVLQRLTRAQREQAEAEAELVTEAAQAEAALERRAEAARKAQEAADREAETERKVADAAAEAKAKIEELAAAEAAMASIADDVESSLAQLEGRGDLETGSAGLKGVASGAIKAERAIKELTSGHGLMRLGSQLEGIVPLLGGPAGLGMAIGAVVVAAVDTLPALKKWFDTWQDGGKVIQDAHKALTDFDTAQKSAHKDMQKHALREVDKEIEVLEAEDRESKAAGLPEYNKEGAEHGLLGRLRARSKVGHAQEKWEKTASGIGLTSAQKKMSAAVKEAVEEAGGMGAVIGEDPNDAAKYILQSAIEGDRESIETLKRWSPEFANVWQALDPVAIRQRKRQEAGEKTKADVETMTKKNVEHREKTETQAKATGFKDQLSELKSQLSDLGLDLKEKTISPEEYKGKADVLVDAIAAAIQGLAQVPGESSKTAKRDIEAAQRTVRSVFDHGVEAVKRATGKAIKDARSAAEKAERAREKWDREHTPEHLTQQEAKQQGEEMMGMARYVRAARADAGDRMAAQMGPRELQQIVAEVGRNRLANSTLGFTIAQQFDYYFGQLEAKMVADFTRGMGQHDRSQQNVNPRGGH